MHLHGTPLRLLLRLSAASLTTTLLFAAARADTPASPNPTQRETPTVMAPMTVLGDKLQDYPLFPPKEVVEANFGPHTATPDLFYPGQAIADGITEGYATIGIEVDETGKPIDYLVIRYTQPYFAASMLRAAKRQDFGARVVKGVAVTGRFNYGMRFVPDGPVTLNSFNAAQERRNEIRGGPLFMYEPHMEKTLDGGGLTMVDSTVALIPDGYTPPSDKPLLVLVSFYVDETGKVRLPNVEAAPSPLLIRNAIQAVNHWSFRPPTWRGKPVLAFSLYKVVFVPRTALIPRSGG